MKAIIAGGGTGGHLYPGITVAREIQRRYPGAEILFVGAEQGIETRIVPKEGFALRTLPVGGLKRMGWQRQVKNAFAMMKGLFTARRILHEYKPNVVVGVGGYASFPMVAAAILGGYPRVIMEQNALPGLANRVLGKWVDFAAVADPRTTAFFGNRAVVTGNPIRPEFKAIPRKEHVPPFTVMVTGGSQGAQAINRAVLESLNFLAGLKDKLRFVHQAGEREADDVRRGYQAKGFEADVRSFFHDFHQQYATADVIISRAGAMTVAELKAAGRVAILIPLPTAADDHQTKNAKAMVAEDAAILVTNSDLSGQRLADEIKRLLTTPGRLTEMEENARRIAILDAEERIVNLVQAAIEKHV